MVIKDPQLQREQEAYSAFERVLGALVMGSLSGVVFYGIYWLLTSFLEIPYNLAISSVKGIKETKGTGLLGLYPSSLLANSSILY